MESPDHGLRNAVKEKLARNEPVYSMAVRLVRTVEIATIARTAGYDSIYIDLEHSGISLDAAGQICVASIGMGLVPFVRVPSADAAFVTRALDGGALGVIAPHVRSAADARALVRIVKYPPLGDRSLAGTLPQLGYRTLPAAQATRQLNDATMVIVMIECGEGVAAVEAIAAVPGVDIVLVGTNDLCSALGVPGELDHELVRDAYRQSLAACRTHGKVLGIGGLASRPDLIRKYVGLGGRYVSAGTDLAFLLAAAASKRKEVEAGAQHENQRER
jgi:2-keto-3-deoxy-L-rhamnonate aldolase RhmA